MNAGVDRPLIGRGLVAAQVPAVEIEHDDAIQRGAARADAGDGQKGFRAGDANAHVAEAVRNALPIEDMAAVDEFLFEFFEIAGIESRDAGRLGSHENSSELLDAADGFTVGNRSVKAAMTSIPAGIAQNRFLNLAVVVE
jgi:hypothetical protein